ncbi:radical SAM protein [Haliangium sp.]|uniref:radical SAM protein n=1 Tax=Haliangium sp. TaxID=2663208 RepID=UPI003D149228
MSSRSYPIIKRLAIEVSGRCSKRCWFCYNHSTPDGPLGWTAAELVGFVRDCAEHGVDTVSLGGGEPLEWPEIFTVLDALAGHVRRTVTSNGLPLEDAQVLSALVEARPERVQLSIHHPHAAPEVHRVLGQVRALEAEGIDAGVNVLVRSSQLAAAAALVSRLRDQGLRPDQVLLLPMRGGDTPTPKDMAGVVGAGPFLSMSCLLACGPSPGFCTVRHDRSVSWCSYTTATHALVEPTYAGLLAALDRLPLRDCARPEGPDVPLVRLRSANVGASEVTPLVPRGAVDSPPPPRPLSTAGDRVGCGHSMDSTWFAVDMHGCIAKFWSAEDGHIPIDAPYEPLDELPEGWPEAMDRYGRYFHYDFASGWEIAPRIRKHHPTGLVLGSYERDHVPRSPLRISSGLIKVLENSPVFPLSFEDTELIQPLEFATCNFWEGLLDERRLTDDDVWLLASGGARILNGPIVHGRRHGCWTEYDLDGQVVALVEYEHGREVSRLSAQDIERP